MKWLANGLIAAVLASTLWMAYAIHPEPSRASPLLAQVVPAAAAAASVPATTAR
ncbi:hypothetical protein [Roseateles sp.]|uniref:hypothetical protein n=1 Tax=Roseateles sp. TaxID=1971397 RepID=UPI0025E5EDA8|nr:hypothetical protein [Roseateles sp.]MBV8036291.1 hypothetical protein [Roseateles sp.]